MDYDDDNGFEFVEDTDSDFENNKNGLGSKAKELNEQ